MGKLNYTWDQFFKDIEILATDLKTKNYDSILVITRGGLFPAAILAQKLNIRVIETIGLKSYIAGQKQVIEVTKGAKPETLGKKTLIVDDICDSGESLKYVQERFKADSAVLFYKPTKAKSHPSFYVNETKDWIVFPWEEDDGK